MTDNHNFSQPAEGSLDWHEDINSNFDTVEVGLENRDVESNLGNYTPHDGAKFFATDTENVFLGNGSDWVQLDTFGSRQSFTTLSVSDSLTVPVYSLLSDYPSPSAGDVVVIDGQEDDEVGQYVYDGTDWIGPFATSQSFTTADAVEAINQDPDHGQTADHDYYTDAEAVDAVNNDPNHSANAAHSHADLTDVQADQHHARYTDSEARSAVVGNVDAADLTGESASADQVLQYDGSDVIWSDQSGQYTDADAVDAINSDPDHSATAAHSHTDLSNVQPDQHHSPDQSAEYVEGGAYEIDASEFAGSMGSSGQVLSTDGTSVSWTDPGAASVDGTAISPSGLTVQGWNWVDIVEQGADNTGGSAVDSYVTNAIADNTLLVFPPGTYLFNGTVTLDDWEDVMFWAPNGATFTTADSFNGDWLFDFGSTTAGDGLRFEGITFDVSSVGAVRARAVSDLTVADCEFPNAKTGTRSGAALHHLDLAVTSAEGTGKVDHVNMTAGGSVLTDQTNPGGIAVGSAHAGTLTVSNANVAGFPNYGLDTAGASGPVHVESGSYRNCGNGCLRLDGAGSAARDVEVTLDANLDSGFPSPRGVVVDGSTSATIDSLRLLVDTGTTNPAVGVTIAENTGSMTIRDSQFVVEDSVRSVLVDGVGVVDPVSFTSCRFVGAAGSGSTPIAVRVVRDNATFSDCYLDQPNRDGLQIVGDDGAVTGGSFIVQSGGTALSLSGNQCSVSDPRYVTGTITISGDDCMVEDTDGATVDRSNATRAVVDGLGYNSGDPSSTGDWAGNGFEGARIRDTVNGVTYTYEDGAWRNTDDAQSVNGSEIHIGSSAPSNPETNDIWIDTS